MAAYPAASVAYGEDGFHNVSNLGISALSGDINAVQTSFAVDDATTYEAWPTENFVVRVDQELIFVSTRVGGTLNAAARPFAGVNASHLEGAKVRVVLTAEFVAALAEEVIALQEWPGVLATTIHDAITATPYAAGDADFLLPVDATAGAKVVNLPTAVGRKGRAYLVIKKDSSVNTVTIDGSGAETIGGSATKVLSSQNESAWLWSDGANWHLFSAGAASGSSNAYDTFQALTVKPITVGKLRWVPPASGAVLKATAKGAWQNLAGTIAQSVFAFFNEGFTDSQQPTTSNGGTLWVTGDKLQLCTWVTCTLFSDLAANFIMGVGFNRAGIGHNNDLYHKTSVASNITHITVGPDSTGTIYVIVSDGATKSATSTGVVAVSGTRFKVEITYIKGTSVSVSINGGTPTVVPTNLPTYIDNAHAGMGTCTTAGTKIVGTEGDMWKFTPA